MRTVITLFFINLVYTLSAGIVIEPIHPVGGGACDGGIKVVAEGDAGPYYVAVEGPGGFQDAAEDVSGAHTFSGLCAGEYVVTVSSELMCARSDVVTLICEPPVDISTTAACSPSGGTVTVTPTVQGTYTYQWTDASGHVLPATNALTDLEAGDYYLTVSADNGCVLTRRIAVGEVDAFTGAVPYVEWVEVVWESPAGEEFQLYSGQWVETAAGCLYFDLGEARFPTPLSRLGSEGTTTVRVLTSEGLESLTVEIGEAAPAEIFPLGNAPNRLFEFTIDYLFWNNRIRSDETVFLPLTFDAADADGNPLLDMRTMSKQMNNCVKLPFVDENCRIQPEAPAFGKDNVHIIAKECAVFSLVTNPAEKSVRLPEDLVYEKVDWEGPNNFVYYDPVIQPAYPGEYCATVKITDGCVVEQCATLCAPFDAEDVITYRLDCDGQFYDVCVKEQYETMTLQVRENDYSPCLNDLDPGEVLRVEAVDLVCNISVPLEIRVPDDYYAPGPPTVKSTEVMPSCPGEAAGRICVEVSEAVFPPYTYIWSNGASGSCLENAEEGITYQVTVTDGCGRESVAPFSLPAYQTPLASIGEVTPACVNTSNGAVKLNVDRGIPPYTFQWTGGSITSKTGLIESLSAGNYNVTVTDACGTATSVINLQIPSFTPDYNLEVVKLLEEPSCLEINLGEAMGRQNGFLYVSGTPAAAGPFTYRWSNGRNGPANGNLFPGDYTVSVTDNNGCEAESEYSVDDTFIDFVGETENTCAGQTVGAIRLYSGQPFFEENTFEWSNGAVTQDNTNLAAGEYCVTVTTPSGCRRIECFYVQEEVIEISLEGIESSSGFYENENQFYDDATGSIDIKVSGGAPPYTYFWSNGAADQDLNQIPSDNYTVTVTDSEGCEQTLSVYVGICNVELTGLAVDIQSSSESEPCNIQRPGSMAALVKGGTPPYDYQWSGPENFSAATESISGLGVEGEYCVTITDACGNMGTACQILTCNCYKFRPNINWVVEDPCMNIWFKTAKVGMPRNIFYNIPPPYDEEILQVTWPDGSTGVFTYWFAERDRGVLKSVRGEGRAKFRDGDYGPHTVIVTNRMGCSYEYSGYFFEEPAGEIEYARASLYQMVADWGYNASNNYSVFFGCRGCRKECAGECRSGWKDPDKFKYIPTSYDDPCFGGGTFQACNGAEYETGSHPGALEFINPNSLFEEEGECFYEVGCLFPLGTVTADGHDGPFYFETRKRVACTDPPLPPPPSPTEDECTKTVTELSTDECREEVICINTGEVLSYVSRWDAPCIIPSGDLCSKVRICSYNSSLVEFLGFVESCGENTCTALRDKRGEYPLQAVTLERADDQHSKLRENGFEEEMVTLIYPNPFSEIINLMVHCPEPTTAVVRFQNMMGRTVLTEPIEITDLNSTFRFRMPNHIAPGMYSLIVQEESGKVFTHKVVYVGKEGSRFER